MCVKEFLGYNCGHCAIPYLRQCPVSASNPTYPPCKFPAERPIYTNENCHPCARVLWNQNVLAEEEAHRKRHQQGECDCPIIFDAADRERRLRPRSKGKGKGKENSHGESSKADRAEGENYDARGTSNFGYDARRDNDGPAGPRQYDNRSEGARESQQQGWAPQGPKSSQTYEYSGYHFKGPGPASTDMEQVARSYGFPQGGYVPPHYLHQNALAMSQPGAGMKWYPEHQAYLPMLPPYPPGGSSSPVPAIMAAPTPVPAPAPTQPAAYYPEELSPLTTYQDIPRFFNFNKKKAASEPAETRYPSFSPVSDSTTVHEDVEMNEENSPLVVSSSGEVDTKPM